MGMVLHACFANPRAAMVPYLANHKSKTDFVVQAGFSDVAHSRTGMIINITIIIIISL